MQPWSFCRNKTGSFPNCGSLKQRSDRREIGNFPHRGRVKQGGQDSMLPHFYTYFSIFKNRLSGVATSGSQIAKY
jgi:hypothetical protein